jgi:monoamine oxidase
MYLIHPLPAALPPDDLALLQKAEPATIGHFQTTGFMRNDIRAHQQDVRIAGTAVTVRMPGSDGGILLASHSWADDALKWAAYADEERYLRALAGVQAVFGRRCEGFCTGKGRTQAGMRGHYAYGEASVLLPGQHTELFPDVPTSEGPLHFAGDHTSIKPAWIEGALESAVRTALAVHTG